MELPSIFNSVLTLSFMGSLVALMLLIIKAMAGNRFSPVWHYYIWLVLLARLSIPYAPSSSFSLYNALNPAFTRLGIVVDTGSLSTSVFYSNSASPEGKNEGEAEEKTGADRNTPFLNTEKELSAEAGIKPGSVTGSAAKNPDSVAGYLKCMGIFYSDILSTYRPGMNMGRTEFLQTGGIIWLTGAGIFLVYMASVNLRLLLKIRRVDSPGNEKAEDLLWECCRLAGVKRAPKLVPLLQINSPALFGILKPRLLISPETLTLLSRDELRYVFLHELVHLKRRDILLNTAALLLLAVNWFNPLIWLAVSKMQKDCEPACDARVLALLEEGEHFRYGEALLKMFELMKKVSPPPFMVGLLNPTTTMERRFKMIVNYKRTSRLMSVLALSIALLTGCAGLTGTVGEKETPDPTETATQAPEETPGLVSPSPTPGLPSATTTPQPSSGKPLVLNENVIYKSGLFSYLNVIKDDGTELIVSSEETLPAEPVISPDKSSLLYISPGEWEELGELFLYRSGWDKAEVLIPRSAMNSNDTPKKVLWLDNENALVIIGFTYGTVSVGGDLYHLNVNDGQLHHLFTDETPELRTEIKSVYIDEADGKRLLSIEFAEFNKDVTQYKTMTVTADLSKDFVKNLSIQEERDTLEALLKKAAEELGGAFQ